MRLKQSIGNLSQFVKAMVKADVRNRPAFNAWKKDPKVIEQMNDWFGYAQKKGMPCINALVTVDFHWSAPLVMLNYTPVAHNTLHEFPKGWTKPLRQCRGIVFDFEGELVAKPFEKFFNYGEHPETLAFPKKESWGVTQKIDGHLGIIFEYKGKIYITTRGRFNSPTVKACQKMLDEFVSRNDWAHNFNREETILVEIILPETKVHVDYNGRQDFVLIGASNRNTLADYDFTNLHLISARLNLTLVDKWLGHSLTELQNLMKDRKVNDQEGFVARFHSGLRIKLKFESYIGLMVQSKLSYKYLMQRKISGNLDRMIKTLPEEIYATAVRMSEELDAILAEKIDAKAKAQKLHHLVPEEERVSYYKTVCRECIKAVCK